MKKKTVISNNYLELCPKRNGDISWKEKDGIVVLEIENRGLMNKIAQKIFKKPKISYVDLDEMGTFIWPMLDGKTDIIEIGKRVKEKFGEEAEPLYERLATYIHILESYNFVCCK